MQVIHSSSFIFPPAPFAFWVASGNQSNAPRRDPRSGLFPVRAFLRLARQTLRPDSVYTPMLTTTTTSTSTRALHHESLRPRFSRYGGGGVRPPSHSPSPLQKAAQLPPHRLQYARKNVSRKMSIKHKTLGWMVIDSSWKVWMRFISVWGLGVMEPWEQAVTSGLLVFPTFAHLQGPLTEVCFQVVFYATSLFLFLIAMVQLPSYVSFAVQRLCFYVTGHNRAKQAAASTWEGGQQQQTLPFEPPRVLRGPAGAMN